MIYTHLLLLYISMLLCLKEKASSKWDPVNLYLQSLHAENVGPRIKHIVIIVDKVEIVK